MSKRFIIAVNTTNAEQESAVTEYLRAKTGVWWHWINNIWLAIDKTNNITVDQLNNEILKLVPGAYMLILEIRGEDNWHGYGPASETDKNKNMFEWLLKTWSGK